MTPWTLEDGLKLIRAIQNDSREFGYHVALGGGVLNRGESEKDIDLYFLPLDNPALPAPNLDGLVKWLTKLWGIPKNLDENYGNRAQIEADRPQIRRRMDEPRPFVLNDAPQHIQMDYIPDNPFDEADLDDDGDEIDAEPPVIRRNPVPVVLDPMAVDRAMENLRNLAAKHAPDINAGPWKPKPIPVYKAKFMFKYKSLDRIDVFIM